MNLYSGVSWTSNADQHLYKDYEAISKLRIGVQCEFQPANPGLLFLFNRSNYIPF